MAVKRALISVSDKTGITGFAKELENLGVEIISTGGTKRAIHEAGIKVKDISEFTGFPEMLDGRVKTLHPLVHGGLLAVRDNSEHQKQAEEHGIKYIDLVCVNLYPFESTIAKEGVGLEEAVENIDIGGPTMLRSAAKNYKFVSVLTDSADYQKVIDEIKENGDTSAETKFELMKKVFAHTARYDGVITNYFSGLEKNFPETFNMQYKLNYELRYGENPHQKAAWYTDVNAPAEASLDTAEKLQGKELSYNNIGDAQACIDILRDVTIAEIDSKPFAVILKHMNPCGAAFAGNPEEAFRKAFAADSISAFGGIIGLNTELDEATAKAIIENFCEIVIAPSFSSGALEVLAAKKNIRVLKLSRPLNSLDKQLEIKRVSGGIIVQDKDVELYNDADFKTVTKAQPDEAQMKELKFAWVLCKHVKSNAIVYTKDGALLGAGAGQMSRVDAAKFGAQKSVSPLEGCVMASDAFFPFRDGVDAAVKLGVKAVIQPGGSKRDDEVIAACDEAGAAMVFTGMRHFKH